MGGGSKLVALHLCNLVWPDSTFKWVFRVKSKPASFWNISKRLKGKSTGCTGPDLLPRAQISPRAGPTCVSAHAKTAVKPPGGTGPSATARARAASARRHADVTPAGKELRRARFRAISHTKPKLFSSGASTQHQQPNGSGAAG